LDLASDCEQWGEELGLVSLLKTWHTTSFKQLEHANPCFFKCKEWVESVCGGCITFINIFATIEEAPYGFSSPSQTKLQPLKFH
jgi:hypothetical protein